MHTTCFATTNACKGVALSSLFVTIFLSQLGCCTKMKISDLLLYIVLQQSFTKVVTQADEVVVVVVIESIYYYLVHSFNIILRVSLLY